MPSVSSAQQRLMGMALAYKRSQKKGVTGLASKVASSMNEGQLTDFARKKKSDLAKSMLK